MPVSNKERIVELQLILSGSLKNPLILENQVEKAVEAYCGAKEAKEKGKRHNVDRDVDSAKKLAHQVTELHDFEALLKFVQGKDREKRSVFLKGPSQGENSLMDFILIEVLKGFDYDRAALKATPREIFEPVLIQYLNTKAEKYNINLEQLKEHLPTWVHLEDHKNLLKNTVLKAIRSYCEEKDQPGRHNIKRDIGIAEALALKVENNDFQALLDHVQGKGKALGSSQKENSLMDFISKNLLEEILHSAKNNQSAEEVRDHARAILTKMTPREVLEPLLIGLIQAEKAVELKEGVSNLRKKSEDLGASDSDEYSI
ncbi:MAG: hypothetical protein QNK11_05225 [Legionella sp.]|nr:hypothetical protein [Legionella sp.]